MKDANPNQQTYQPAIVALKKLFQSLHFVFMSVCQMAPVFLRSSTNGAYRALLKLQSRFLIFANITGAAKVTGLPEVFPTKEGKRAWKWKPDKGIAGIRNRGKRAVVSLSCSISKEILRQIMALGAFSKRCRERRQSRIFWPEKPLTLYEERQSKNNKLHKPLFKRKKERKKIFRPSVPCIIIGTYEKKGMKGSLLPCQKLSYDESALILSFKGGGGGCVIVVRNTSFLTCRLCCHTKRFCPQMLLTFDGSCVCSMWQRIWRCTSFF